MNKEDAHNFIDKLKFAIENNKDEVLLIMKLQACTVEEELVGILGELAPYDLNLPFYVKYGQNLLRKQQYELLKIVKSHIEYNFDVELVTKNGITTYEASKKPRDRAENPST